MGGRCGRGKAEMVAGPLEFAKRCPMEIWDFNLRHLRAIACIADLGTMNAAAQAVSLTQPAITQALGRIEAMLAITLFERRHDGMASTEAAQVLVPRIRSALDHIASNRVTMSGFRAFLALAESGSYIAAAEQTGLAAPSLHRAVSDLALSLRRTLVERHGKLVILTEAGRRLERAFRLAKVELEAGLSELDALTGLETRRIAVGAMPLSRARVVPAAVTRLLARHPQVKVAIIEGSRAELLEPLRNGTIDLMAGALREPLLEGDLIQHPLFEDQPRVIARAGHPLAGLHPSLADMAAYPWVIGGDGTPLRQSWQRMFDDAGVALPAVPVESGSVMVIRQVLMGSDYLTLLSHDQVTVELEAGWLAVIAQPGGLGRKLGITTRASWRPTAVQADFLADLAAAAEPPI